MKENINTDISEGEVFYKLFYENIRPSILPVLCAKPNSKEFKKALKDYSLKQKKAIDCTNNFFKNLLKGEIND